MQGRNSNVETECTLSSGSKTQVFFHNVLPSCDDFFSLNCKVTSYATLHIILWDSKKTKVRVTGEGCQFKVKLIGLGVILSLLPH